MAALDAIEARARRAYELGRLQRAAISAAPMFAVALAVGLLSGHTHVAAGLGLVMFLGGAALLWRGRSLGRAVLPGFVAGLVPLVCALSARSLGHVCTPEGCVSLCVPACFAGGLVAGLMVTRFARGAGSPIQGWLAAGGLAAVTGALGCSCVGYGGVAGLVVGLLLASFASRALPSRLA